MGEYIYKDLGYEIAIIFFYTGKHWNFSLRSDRVDVSVLAGQHGGGGHAGAAGFRKESLDWLFSSKKKS
jgi:nanoRNase/pAp phosphatase (c-di-AMP/oligoRNAs hydrolase)